MFISRNVIIIILDLKKHYRLAEKAHFYVSQILFLDYISSNHKKAAHCKT